VVADFLLKIGQRDRLKSESLNMQNSQTNAVRAIRALAVPLLALLFAVTMSAGADEAQDKNASSLPAALKTPVGNRLELSVRAEGAQVYTWNASSATWGTSTPHAVLYANGKVVGIHFAGPTWQSADGSKVAGKKIAGVTVNADAIPWLLLQATSASGPGLFANVTYIQRLDTRGGLAPASPGKFDGQQILAPYVAEYLFYVAE